jgi:hypothetical protein
MDILLHSLMNQKMYLLYLQESGHDESMYEINNQQAQKVYLSILYQLLTKFF